MHYCVKRGLAIACRPSVRPSVCLQSVTLVDQDHIGWKSWKLITRTHRRTSQRAEGTAAPPDLGKRIIFPAIKAKFLGQKPAAKMKEVFFVFIKRKKEFILSSEIKCPKSGIFTNNYCVR